MLTPLAIGLLAVTFGWTPAEPADGSKEADSYEYHLCLSEADLAALRDGRVDSLSSELPRDLRGVERVRITLGEGTPPRELTRRDRESPRRIAAAGGPQKHVVAKPVVTPEWDDAARLVTSPTAERRTAYQGQGAFGPGGLAEGFRDGVEQTNQFLGDRARDVTEGTRGLLERGGEAVRNSTREVLEGTERVLERGPFVGRPQYDPNAGQQNYPLDRRPLPPAPRPTAAPSDYPQQSQFQRDLPLREPAQPAGPDDRRFVDDRRFADERSDVRGPGFVAPAVRDDGLAQPFAERVPRREEQMTPIPRPRSDEFNAFANQRDFARREAARTSGEAWDRFSDPQRTGREELRRTEAEFPDRRGMADAGFVQTGQREAEYPRVPPYNPPRETLPTQNVSTPPASAPPARDFPAEDWLDKSAAKSEAEAPASETQMSDTRGSKSSQDVMQTVLLVFLTGVTVYTLKAYFELRNRYQMALRGLPGGGYPPGV